MPGARAAGVAAAAVLVVASVAAHWWLARRAPSIVVEPPRADEITVRGRRHPRRARLIFLDISRNADCELLDARSVPGDSDRRYILLVACPSDPLDSPPRLELIYPD